MNYVPWKYRNIINPWQTIKEIRLAIKFANQMTRKMFEKDILILFRANEPDRKWQ